MRKISTLFMGICLFCFSQNIQAQSLKISFDAPNPSNLWPFLWDLKIIDTAQTLLSCNSSGQVLQKNNGTWNIISIPGINGKSVRGVVKDRKGHIWAAADGEGIAYFNDTSWTIFKSGTNGLLGNAWLCATVDTAGGIWFAGDNGIANFNNGTWKHYTASSGLATDYCSTVFIDSKNVKYVFYSTELTTIKDTVFKKYDLWKSMGDGARLSQILEDKNGDIYMAASTGVYKFANDKFVSQASRFAKLAYQSIAIDTNGTFWLGETYKGLHRVKGTLKTFFPGSDTIPSQAFKIIVDKYNRKLVIGNIGAQVLVIDDSELPLNTATSEVVAENIALFPNPCTDILRIEAAYRDFAHAEIIDLHGMTVLRAVVDDQGAINVSDLPAGTYALRLSSAKHNKLVLGRFSKL